MLKGGRSGRVALGVFSFPPAGSRWANLIARYESAFTVLARARQFSVTGEQVVLNSPHNPTGAVLDVRTLARIAEVVLQPDGVGRDLLSPAPARPVRRSRSGSGPTCELARKS
jgi:hypothetical protein